MKNIIINSTVDLLSLKNLLTSDVSSPNRTSLSVKKVFGIYFECDRNDTIFRYTIVTLYPLLQKDSRRIFSDTFAVVQNNKEGN